MPFQPWDVVETSEYTAIEKHPDTGVESKVHHVVSSLVRVRVSREIWQDKDVWFARGSMIRAGMETIPVIITDKSVVRVIETS